MREPSDGIIAADVTPAAWAIGIFLFLWLPAAILSRSFSEADGCTHYLLARFAFAIPSNFTDVWGRPFCTALYSLPAVIGGRFGVCAASALVALGCGIVSFHIARAQGDRLPALALIFTLAQPMLFIHCLTAMTELPFALLLGGAFLAFQRRRWFVAAVLSSLLPLARPEGFGFLLIAACALIWLGPRRWLLLLPMPLVLWDIAGWRLHGSQGEWWSWLIHHWPYSASSMYGRGNVLTFVAELPAVVSPLVLPSTLLGVWQSFRPPHPARIATAVIPLFVLAVHTLLYATGKMASFGEARYLLVAAPFWGVLSARGWEWCFARLRWRHVLRWAGAAALTPILINLVHPLIPLRPAPDWNVARHVAEWYTSSPQQQRYPHLLCSHVGVYYYAGISPSDGNHAAEWDRQTILSVPPGTLLIWDPIYGPRNASADRAVAAEEILKAGWIEDADAEAGLRLGVWRIFHSRS